jgi:hypothetical protein
MSTISKRSSRLAIMIESTGGVPVPPASGADFVALQDDYTLESVFEELNSAELQGTIGQAKSVLGVEDPTAGTSSYLKGSGTQGTAPGNGKMIQAVLGGIAVASTEYDTVAGSTVSVVNVDTGEGVNYQRGQALLVKKTTGVGHEIRNVLSVTGDALTLGFNLADAPGTGVNLGRAVLYKPEDTHPDLTIWEYEGNGGLVQMITGAKAASMAITADPNSFLVSRFEFEGISYFRNPMQVEAGNSSLDFDIGGGELNATVPVKWYKTPHQLAEAVQASMNALASGITVTYSNSTGRFTIAKASGTLELLWDSGTNTATSIGTLLGFDVAADDTGSLSYLADSAQDYSSPFEPVYDSTNPLVAKNGEVYLGDATDIVCFGAQNMTATITNTLASIPDICEESGRASKRVTARAIEMSFVATAKKNDLSKFEKFRNGSNVRFMLNVGEKSGGNWVAGRCVNMFSPTASIVADVVADVDDVTVFNLTVRCHVEQGAGEFYINYV